MGHLALTVGLLSLQGLRRLDLCSSADEPAIVALLLNLIWFRRQNSWLDPETAASDHLTLKALLRRHYGKGIFVIAATLSSVAAREAANYATVNSHTF